MSDCSLVRTVNYFMDTVFTTCFANNKKLAQLYSKPENFQYVIHTLRSIWSCLLNCCYSSSTTSSSYNHNNSNVNSNSNRNNIDVNTTILQDILRQGILTKLTHDWLNINTTLELLPHHRNTANNTNTGRSLKSNPFVARSQAVALLRIAVQQCSLFEQENEQMINNKSGSSNNNSNSVNGSHGNNSSYGNETSTADIIAIKQSFIGELSHALKIANTITTEVKIVKDYKNANAIKGVQYKRKLAAEVLALTSCVKPLYDEFLKCGVPEGLIDMSRIYGELSVTNKCSNNNNNNNNNCYLACPQVCLLWTKWPEFIPTILPSTSSALQSYRQSLLNGDGDDDYDGGNDFSEDDVEVERVKLSLAQRRNKQNTIKNNNDDATYNDEENDNDEGVANAYRVGNASLNDINLDVYEDDEDETATGRNRSNTNLRKPRKNESVLTDNNFSNDDESTTDSKSRHDRNTSKSTATVIDESQQLYLIKQRLGPFILSIKKIFDEVRMEEQNDQKQSQRVNNKRRNTLSVSYEGVKEICRRLKLAAVIDADELVRDKNNNSTYTTTPSRYYDFSQFLLFYASQCGLVDDSDSIHNNNDKSTVGETAAVMMYTPLVNGNWLPMSQSRIRVLRRSVIPCAVTPPLPHSLPFLEAYNGQVLRSTTNNNNDGNVDSGGNSDTVGNDKIEYSFAAIASHTSTSITSNHYTKINNNTNTNNNNTINNNNLWVALEDLTDIFSLAGLTVAKELVAESLEELDPFLLPRKIDDDGHNNNNNNHNNNGNSSGRRKTEREPVILCFQELLAIYNYCAGNEDHLRNENMNAASINNLRTSNDRNIVSPQLSPSKTTNKSNRRFQIYGDADDQDRNEYDINTNNRNNNSRNSNLWDNPIRLGWELPTRLNAHGGQTPEEILREFRQLDMIGNEKLNYLNLRTALEVRGISSDDIDDEEIRQWISVTDLENKGYVSLEDYQNIYKQALNKTSRYSSSSSPAYSSYQRGYNNSNNNNYYDVDNIENTNDININSNMTSNANNNNSSNKQRNEMIDKARHDQLQKAFIQYDIDNDGYISAADLTEAFAARGKYYSAIYVNEWIKRRDLSGNGHVSFRDFALHFHTSL